MAKHKCAYCKEYFDKESMIQSGLSSFCSKEHMLKKMNKNSRPKKKRSSLPSEVREEVLALDGYRCRFCGHNDRPLAVHHIMYRSEDSLRVADIDNLITLCNQPCHLYHVHGNKKLYQDLCKQIILRRKSNGDKKSLIIMLELELNVQRFPNVQSLIEVSKRIEARGRAEPVDISIVQDFTSGEIQ